MKQTFFKKFMLICGGIFSLTLAAENGIDPEMAQARLDKLNSRQRRVIFNNDGCEISNSILREPSVENFLKLRHNGLIGSHVDAISFCPVTCGFGNVTYPSRIFNDLTNHPKFRAALEFFYANNTDPMMESLRFAHAHNMESFLSIRMNDCHDSFTGGEHLWPPFKTQHPELLFSTRDRRPPYGYWNGVDYSKKAMRDVACAFIREIVERYPLDGIELDFCRHWTFLRSAAFGDPVTQAEIDGMTDMIRQMRIICDEAGRKRNRPILLMVRVLDSVEACLAQGLDLEKWCADGLVDIVAGGSEIRLNQVNYMAQLARRYPRVRFYTTQTEAQMTGQHPTLKRNNNPLNFRGQAALAHYENVGIYSFNEYFPGLDHARYLNEIGDERMLMGLNKFYYFSHVYSNAGSFGRDWERFQVMPKVVPISPFPFNRTPQDIELYCGRENPGAKMLLMLQLRSIGIENTAVSFNGTALGGGRMVDGLAVYEVPQEIWHPGKNIVSISSRSDAAPRILLAGDCLLVYGENQGAWRRLFGSEGFVAGQSEVIENGAYVLSDVTDTHVFNLAHPLEATAGSNITISVDAKLDFSTDPEAAIIRIANGRFTETLQFTAEGIRLKNAGFFHPCDTRGGFHRYTLNINRNTLTLKIDDRQVYSGEMSQPFAGDSQVVESHSAAKMDYLAGNSIIIGSLSPQGKSRIAFRNLSMLNSSVGGYLVDGALLVIHDPENRDLPVAFTPTLADRNPGGEKLVTVLAPDNHSQWVKHASSANFSISADGFLLNNRVNGPVLRLPLKGKSKLLEVKFSYTARDLTENNPQLQALIMLDGIPGKSNLWGFRFTGKSVRFVDEPAVEFTAEPGKPVAVRILVDPQTGAAEVYIGDSLEPVLRSRPLVVNRGTEAVSFGDGSVAVKGETMLHHAEVTLHDVQAPPTIKDKLNIPVQSTAVFTPGQMQGWQKLFFNSANLVTTGEYFQLNNQRGGPMLRHTLASGSMRYLSVEFEFSTLDEACTKAQLQTTIVVDAADAAKSYLWGYRFGKDHFRFLEEAPLPLAPMENGRIHVLVLIDRENDTAEIFFNHSPFPALVHKAHQIARSAASTITFGDGSAAVEGASRFYRAEVKVY